MVQNEPINVPLGTSDWRRVLSKEPYINVRNRYFEKNPTNLEGETALFSRPGLRKLVQLGGQGPVRQVYTQPGTFDESIFAMSYDTLYKVKPDLTVTAIGPGVFTQVNSTPSFVATGNIGTEIPEYLFIAEGGVLWLYLDNGYARGQLQATGAIANTDVVRIDAMYYQWTNASVNAGTPAGTAGNPWLVALGTNNTEALDNLFHAVNMTGTAGTTYSTALTKNLPVTAYSRTPTTLVVRAVDPGIAGNAIVTTDTGANIGWGAGTLTNGGNPSLTQVPVPDDVGVVSLGYVASYVIVVIAQGNDVNGRFYWIEPGETTIDPLNFATAEKSPDPVHSVRVVGDQFWLLGSNSTEVWYPTGVQAAPFQRVQGRLFERGIWQGTDVQIKDFVVLVDTDGVVYKIGSSPEPISDHSIEERIRNAMVKQVRSGS